MHDVIAAIVPEVGHAGKLHDGIALRYLRESWRSYHGTRRNREHLLRESDYKKWCRHEWRVEDEGSRRGNARLAA